MSAEAPVVIEPKIETPPISTVEEIVKAAVADTQPPEEKPKEEPRKPIWDQVKDDEKKPEQKKEEKTEEPKKEAPKSEPKPEPKKEMSSAARENFARVEKERDDARNAHEELKKQFEELKSKSSEYETVSQELQSIQQERDQLREQLEHVRTELRAASIERDPAFTKKYVEGRKSEIEDIQKLLPEGTKIEHIERAIEQGDEDQISEWRDGMNSTQRYEFDASMQNLAALEKAKRKEIKDANETYQRLAQDRQKAGEAHTNQLRQQNVQVAREVEELVFSEEAWSQDTELRTHVSNVLKDVSHGNLTPKAIMTMIATGPLFQKAAQIQAKVIEQRDADIEAKDKENEDLKKKVAELEEFITKQSGSVPRDERGGGNGASKAYVPSWERAKQ